MSGKVSRYFLKKRSTIPILLFLTSGLFLSGFLFLFVINPQAFGDLSINGLNIPKMNGRWVLAIFSYILPPITGTTALVLIFKSSNKSSLINLSIVLILIALSTWFSFGIIFHDPSSVFSNHTLIIRSIMLTTFASLGLVLFGIEIIQTRQKRGFGISTIIIGLLIISLSIGIHFFIDVSKLLFRDNTSLIIFALWFALLGLSEFGRNPEDV